MPWLLHSSLPVRGGGGGGGFPPPLTSSSTTHLFNSLPSNKIPTAGGGKGGGGGREEGGGGGGGIAELRQPPMPIDALCIRRLIALASDSHRLAMPPYGNNYYYIRHYLYRSPTTTPHYTVLYLYRNTTHLCYSTAHPSLPPSLPSFLPSFPWFLITAILTLLLNIQYTNW